MSLIVPPNKLADVWPEVAPWIEDAIAFNGGDENLLDVLIALARGQYTLWHQPGRFVGVIQIVQFPRQTVATVIYCGGVDLKGIALAFEYGKRWARENGIAVIRTYGRPGWEKLLGLKRRGVALEIAL